MVKKRVSGFRVYFDICDSAGELIFRSFNDEKSTGKSVVESGKYVSRTQIPANLLGPTKYILIIRATIHNVRSCTGDGVKIPLSVVQDGLYNSAYPDDSFTGKLGITLDWENSRLRG